MEKAYYFRFLTFIANEHVMSKLGNKTKECSGFAATWHESLSDKLAAGNIYDRLSLVWPDAETTGSISSVVLRFSENDENDMSNFRTGDIVILYAYEKDKEPDARRTMVLRCTIEDIQTDRIVLALRAAQTDKRMFVKEQGKLWAIEHDFMESSYSSLYKGMQAFLSAPQQRRDLLLLQREPQTDNTLQLKGNYEGFNDLALRVKRAKDLFLIIGPPGTGKTSFGLLYTVKEELLEPNASILLMSYTNRAVDEICSKLTNEGIDFIRIGNMPSCAEEYRNRLLSSIAQHATSVSDLRNRLITTRVLVGTTSSLSSNIALFQLKQFSLAVIDEASQILEPHLIGLLSASKDGEPAIRKFVMIGDHKQLPAVVQQKPVTSAVHDTLLNSIGLTDCRMSLFERLLKQYHQNEEVTYMLRKQGRMHPDIACFPNEAFYHGLLVPVPLPHQEIQLPLAGDGENDLADLIRTRRVMFLASQKPVDSPNDKVNLTEAGMIAAIVLQIYETEKDKGFDVNETIGVIVPYRNQIAAIRKAIDQRLEYHGNGASILHDIAIDTVERFQGSQRKYIVYGFTVQKSYQLDFLTDTVFQDYDGTVIDRKLNVAMTRAEDHLIMVGNDELLSHNPVFARLMDFVSSMQGFFRIPKDDFHE
jgi:superfamily I DNA and/or RNA helicase